MFVWIQFHFDSHPSVTEVEEKSLEQRLWIALADAGVLFGPGDFFAADPSQGKGDYGHFRISFSNAEYSDLRKAVDIFTRVVKDFFA
jgi:aromatic amino acid aminotransferase I